MTELEVLQAARKRIEKPENWIQNCLAQDAQGNECLRDEPRAVKFCIYGAMSANFPFPEPSLQKAWLRLQDILGANVITFNNTHTHEEVLKLIDKGIASYAADLASV